MKHCPGRFSQTRPLLDRVPSFVFLIPIISIDISVHWRHLGPPWVNINLLCWLRPILWPFLGTSLFLPFSTAQCRPYAFVRYCCDVLCVSYVIINRRIATVHSTLFPLLWYTGSTCRPNLLSLSSSSGVNATQHCCVVPLSEVPFPHGLWWPNCVNPSQPPQLLGVGWMELVLHYAWSLHPVGLSKSLIAANIKALSLIVCHILQPVNNVSNTRPRESW